VPTLKTSSLRLWGWGSFHLRLPPLPLGELLVALWWLWVAGVIDGDGYLSAKGGGRLVVAGRWEEEPGILRWLQRLMGGFGDLSHSATEKHPDGKGAAYILTDPILLRWLLRNCGGYFQNPVRRAQAARLANKLGMALPPQQPPHPAWALGLFEADGYLGLEQKGNSYILALRVEVNEEALTAALRSLFGGAVWWRPATEEQLAKNPRHRGK